MINYQDALSKINAQSPLLSTISLPLITAVNHAVNHVCAEYITCTEMVPPFHNSAMDGYALRRADTLKASNQSPVFLDVIGRISAGDARANLKKHLKNTAVEIMTGAALPSGYDAVIPLEDVVLHSNKIIIDRVVKDAENIRVAGSDFNRNDTIIEPDKIITPNHVMALAAIGVDSIAVKKRPTVSVICTGNELVDNTTQFLEGGKIRNVNAPYLKTMLPMLGVDLQQYMTLPDDPMQFQKTLQDMLSQTHSPNIIITTGGVSAGRLDFIPDALQAMGATIIFHKVKIRPGKPILFATLNNTFFFGLPGNPISTAVGLRFFVYPLLQKLLNLPREKPTKAKLLNHFTKKSEFCFFTKAFYNVDVSGQLTVTILSGQESYKISPMIQANCWAFLSADKESYEPNEFIDIYRSIP